MKATYLAVKDLINTLDFNQLNEGFRPYPFALYDDQSYYFKDDYQPLTDQFRGNTTIFHEGEYIAIWNMTFDPHIDLYHLTAGIVHEMYHAHQMTHHKTEYPEDMKLIREDLSIDYCYLLHQEALVLIRATMTRDPSLKEGCLKEVLALRKARQALNANLFQQELNLENFEGIAEYVGYKALCLLSPDQGRNKLQRYRDDLSSMKHLLSLRWLTYGKSALFFDLLEALQVPFKNVDLVANPNYYENILTTYDQDDLNLDNYENRQALLKAIEDIYHMDQVKIKGLLDDFHKNKPSKVDLEGMICGYDPLNMVKYKDHLFCKHFIALDFGKGPEFLQGPLLLKLDPSHPMKILHYYL